MFTKLILLTSLAFALWGCAKEDVPASHPVHVDLKGGGGDCIAHFTDKISQFQKGEMNESEIIAFWSCVQKAVSDYQRLTAGDRENGSYTPQAIRRFLQRYFLKTSDISDSLLSSIMEIKRVLLAGSSDAIAHEELTKAQVFLALIRDISLQLNPHAKVVFFHADAASDEEIRLAGEVVSQSMRRLGEWLGDKSQAYTFAQIRELLRNLKGMGGEGEQASKLFENLEKALDVLPAAKQILLNGHKNSIHGNEWLRLCSSLADSYRVLLSVNYAFKADLTSALNRGAFPDGLVFVVDVLERGVLAHAQSEIPLSEWQELFEQVHKTGWLGEEFNAESLMHAFQWVLNRALSHGQGDPASAMTLSHLAVLRQVLVDWSMLRGGVGPLAKRFASVLQASAPHEWDGAGRMAFPLRPAKTWTAENKLRMVWPFVVMNWMKDAYVPPEVVDLNDDQMTLAATDVLSVLQKFGWMMDTSPSIGKKLLRESDLFTLASNGNGGIDLNEATRYLVFVASSFRSAQVWLQVADEACGGRVAACVREVGADPKRDVLTSMPRLQAWLKTDTVSRFVTYTKAAEDTILEEITEGEFSTGDLLQIWMIFQYVETFLQHFDGGFTETIDLQEATAAYGLFGPTLGALLEGAVPPNEVFGFFTFMMKYGDTPFTMYGGQVAYNHWRWHRNNWAFEADRSSLMGILNQLSKL